MHRYLKLPTHRLTKPLIQYLTIRRASAGFTLTELLVASALTVVVVGAAGYGLVTILNRNKVANAASQTQQMLNLGMEFVTEEVEAASSIDTAYSAANSPQFEKVRNKGDIPVLSLYIPGLSERVVYFTRDNSNVKSPIWAGPTVLYRFGPYVNSTSGDYLNPTKPDLWGNGDPLIDLIGSNANLTTVKAPKTCSDTSGAWTRMPAADSDLRGFFACVRNKGDVAELRALSVMDMKGTTASGDKLASYQLVSQASTRSKEVPALDGGGAILDPFTMKTNINSIIIGQVIYKANNPCPSDSLKNDNVTISVNDGVIGTFKVSTTPQKTSSISANAIRVQGVDSSCKLGTVTFGTYDVNVLSGSGGLVLRAKKGDKLSSLAFPKTIYKGNSVAQAAVTTALGGILETIKSSAYYDKASDTIILPSNQNLFFIANSNQNKGDKPSGNMTFDTAIILTTVSKQ
jgi:type II secretory pathway pseudopilin PulG